MDGDTAPPISGGRKAGAVAGLVLGIAGTLLGLLLLLGGILEATGSQGRHSQQGQSTGSGIGVAVLGAALTAAFAFLAVRSEHHLRRHQPAAASWKSRPLPAAPGRPGNRRSGRNYTPLFTLVIAVIVSILTAVGIGSIFSVYNEGQTSSLVQHHGVRAVGIVISVSNHYHSGSRSGGYYTADMAVTIQPPVLGASSSTVHFPGHLSYRAGEPVDVLIDPHDPSYAELPGANATSSWEWIVIVVLSAFGVLMSATLWRNFIRLERHRRGVNAAA